MRKTKKILALVLALFTLMSVMAIPSYAATSLPTVKFIEFTDGNPVSLKQLELYFNEMEDLYEEWGDLYDGVEVIEETEGYSDLLEGECYYFDYSDINYTLIATLSNGEEHVLETDNYFSSWESEDYEVYANVYVTYDDYMEAKESNADVINVTVEGIVTDYDYENATEETFVYEMDLVECFVKSIKPVSGIPTYVYENCDYIHNIIGGKFLVTYADGTKETLTVEWDSEYCVYTLGGNPFSVWLEDDYTKLGCQFIDAVYEKPVIPIAEPFESIEITNCDFDSRSNTVTLAYTINLKNGNAESFEATIDSVGFEEFTYYVIDSYLGFDIYFTANEYTYDEEGNIDADNYLFTVDIGYAEYVSDTYEVENPKGFFVKIRVWFENVIEIIRNFFYNLFGYEDIIV